MGRACIILKLTTTWNEVKTPWVVYERNAVTCSGKGEENVVCRCFLFFSVIIRGLRDYKREGGGGITAILRGLDLAHFNYHTIVITTQCRQ